MKWIKLISVILFSATTVHAQGKTGLTLNRFLEDVKAHNPDARAAVENITSFQLREREADIPLVPEFYAQYGQMDDKKPTAQPMFMGTETQGNRWRAGFRKLSDFGLGADLYFNAQRTIIENVSPGIMPVNNFMESSAVLQLTQSLWRNGFGEGTRAQIEANRAVTEIALLQNRFRLKTMLLDAQNAYWSVVSYNQVVKLQQENVERAKKLRDYMNNRTRLRLFDDTDAMQAQASFEARDLELQNSLDERAKVVRQFNTFRGLNSDEIEPLEGLASEAMIVEAFKNPSGRMSREDFDLLRAEAKAEAAKTKFARSQIQPQLDLQASVATNGRDGVTTQSYSQAETSRYPTWSIGINFSVPLDFGLVRDLRHGFRNSTVAAENMREAAEFNETRAWNDLNKQKKEAQGRYERSLSIEKLQTNLVKRERQRLLSGRATTFEAINFEQNLALAQIQRVRAQLALLQIHNAIKTFEVAK